MRKFKILPILAAVAIAAASCSQTTKQINVIPYPNSVEFGCGSFDAAGASIAYAEGVDAYTEQAICEFARQLSFASGKESEVVKGSASKGFIFEVEESLPAEAYEIVVSRKAVKVKASALNGFLYAIETLKQMLPVAIYAKGPDGPQGQGGPRGGHARPDGQGAPQAPQDGQTPPQGAPQAPQDGQTPPQGAPQAPQGGQTPPQGAPQAPQGGQTPPQGAPQAPQGGQTPPQGAPQAPQDKAGPQPAEADWTLPCVTIKDAPRFAYRGQLIDIARHFYDVREMKKIIDIMLTHKLNTLHWHLTDDQGWRIEIEKYPRLTSVGSVRKGTMIKKQWGSSDGIPYGGFYTKDQIREIIGYAASKGITIIPEIDLPGHMLSALAAYPEYGCGGPYEVWQSWGVSEDVLCAGNDKTMQFLEDILSEVADLFPSEYFHIGGDECPKVKWEKCPVCQAKIKELGLKDGEYTAEHYLQSYVMERMEKFLATKGKKIIGWDEILEGSPSPSATIMSWRGTEGGIKASKMGHDVIMTPNNFMYLDYYQSADTENEPFGIGGYVPLQKTYSYEPYTDEMDDNARNHIIGVQANLWTEYIREPWHLEYMLLPRQAALSEVQWCNADNKDWDRFYESLPKEMAMYDFRGYNYSKAVYTDPGLPEKK